MDAPEGPPTTRSRQGRRRRWVWAVVGAVVVGAVVVLVWFQPQKLLVDETVSDRIPDAVAQSDAGSAGPEVAAQGSFVSLDHRTEGAVRILKLGDGSRVLRIEQLATDNGPDLYVYLSTSNAAGPESAFDDDYVSLGRLRGNRGDQNYDVPADVDLTRFASVVIWCDRFNSAFGAADLAAA